MDLATASGVLRLLADPTRVRLLALLENEELTVAELAAVLHLAQPRVSTHLAKLKEAELVRTIVGPKLSIVTPGIRPSWAEHGDQKRVSGPRAALDAGASHLVVGRPITGAADPAEAARRILAEMAGGTRLA